MSMFNVAIINGDGYSEILTAAAKRVLTTVSEKFGFSLNFNPVDARAFLEKSESEILKTDEYKVVKSADAAIAGAIYFNLQKPWFIWVFQVDKVLS